MTNTYQELNSGMIRTDTNCRGCNKCLSGCPIFGANVAIQQQSESVVHVDPQLCVQCGRCLDHCTHDARIYEDDTDRLLRDLEALRNGGRRRPIALVFAPSFLLNYPKQGPQVLGWLSSLGASGVYSAAFGADIATWAYIQYMKRTGRTALISSACPTVVETVEKHYPNLIDHLIPVQSPQMCTAIYLRDQLKIETDVAFISPCVAKKNEINRPDTRSYVQYNVTFPRLMAACKNMDLQAFETLGSQLDFGPGALFPVPGGLSENVRFYLGDSAPVMLQAEGSDLILPLLAAMASDTRREEEDLALRQTGLLDLLSCPRGCVYGSATEFKNRPLGHIPLEILGARRHLSAPDTPEARLAALEARFGHLDLQQYAAGFSDASRPVALPDADELAEVFRQMYKFSKEDQTVDCSACGCESCRQMAQAIHLGLNHLGNCIQYVRTRLGLEHAQAAAGLQRLAALEEAESPRTGSADHLTGLDVRIDLEQRLEKALEAERGGYLFGADLDDFVAVNESYGHGVGNQLLVAVARFLRKEFGVLCTLYRMGGDEFALLAEGVDAQTAQHIESVLLHKGREPWELSGIRVYCTVSIGVAALDRGSSAGALVDRVEIALEAAKARGKNTCVHYVPELDRQGGAQVQLLHQMRDDVLGGFRGFEVYFQPWVTCSGDLQGAEALVRWKGADGRFVPPPDFIPVAEAAGLIVPIGDFVLRRAAEKCLEANVQHPAFTVSVNVSAKQFARPDFYEHTMAVLDDVGVNKENIILEITESLGFEDVGHQAEILTRFKAEGVQIAMDDFGTGYSSLSYLNELPLDLIKIDRSFILDLETENYSQYLLATMTDLMHKMGRRVVVEGVETRRQLELCQDFGVDTIQGFLFFRPMPGSQLTQLLKIV